ncbi:hypothetical protein ABG067_002456 [Albugo candida]
MISNPMQLDQLSLSKSQKIGFLGLCGCRLALVNDTSIDLEWSKRFLSILSKDFLKLDKNDAQAYYPFLDAKSEEPIDPKAFLNLLVEKIDDNQDSLVTGNALHWKIFEQLLWFIVFNIGYDARARTMCRHLAASMEISWSKVMEEETIIGRELYAEAMKISKKKFGGQKKGIWNWKRNMAIGAAAVTGGTLLAVTGGLAAPAISASLAVFGTTGAAIGTAIGSTAGVTATSILFGTTGASVIGFKTDKRTRGVQELCFDLITAGDGMNVYICVTGWLDKDDIQGVEDPFRLAWGDTIEYLRMYQHYHNLKEDAVDTILELYRGREMEFITKLRKMHCQSIDGEPNSADNSRCSMCDEATASTLELVHEEITPSKEQASLLRGWCWKDRFKQADQYCLIWEEKLLLEFGMAMRSITKDKLLSFIDYELIKHTTLAALFAAVTIPRAVFRAFDMIDNIWTLIMNAADQGGKILAKALCQREQGLRPVTLIGYGMGARLIFSCLKELVGINAKASGNSVDGSHTEANCLGIIENAVFLGTPVPASVEEWESIRSVVAGRIINGFSKNDWMLALMYRYQGWAFTCAGIAPLEAKYIENVDLSSIIKGHLEYKYKMAAILDFLHLED